MSVPFPQEHLGTILNKDGIPGVFFKVDISETLE